MSAEALIHGAIEAAKRGKLLNRLPSLELRLVEVKLSFIESIHVVLCAASDPAEKARLLTEEKQLLEIVLKMVQDQLLRTEDQSEVRR